MASQTLPPDGVLDSTNYSTLNLADIDEDPDSPDGAWGANDGNGDTICRVSFDTPSNTPTTGADLQEFRVLIRKDSSGGNNTDWSLQLWENGVQLSVLATGTTTSTSGEVVNGTWDASSLGTADGSLVECRLEQTGGGTGNPGNRRFIEVGAVEWNATIDVASQTLTPSPVAIPLAVSTPTIVPGEVTLTPVAVTMPLMVPTPNVFIGVTLTPDPVTIPLNTPTPTIVAGTVSATPDPVAVNLVISAPTITPGPVILTPSPVVLTLAVATPQLNQRVNPSPAAIPLVIGTPNLVVGAVTLQPDSAQVVLSVPAPTVTNMGGGGPPNPKKENPNVPEPLRFITFIDDFDWWRTIG